MSTTFVQDALPVTVVGTPGVTQVSLLDVLKQAYGDQVSSISSIKIGYWDASYMASITSGTDQAGKPISNPFSYWDPANATTTMVLNSGVDIGGSHLNSKGQASFQVVTVDNAHFKDITIAVGNNIMPNITLQVAITNNGTDTVWQELNVTTIPQQFAHTDILTEAATGHPMPTALDVVASARNFANLENGVHNTNDCHWIAMDIAASVGAPLDPNTQSWMLGSDGKTIVETPANNEEGGFWRIAYRGSDANPVSDWQTLVKAGDIVRVGWSDADNDGFHSFTVTAGLNADGKHPGKIEVVDNGGNEIHEHWVDYDGSHTKPESVTIYRLTTDNRYLIDDRQDTHAHNILGTTNNDLIYAGTGGDTLRGGQGNDMLVGGAGKDTLDGGDGNDILRGGAGDTLLGEAGNDVYIVDDASAAVRDIKIVGHNGFVPVFGDAGGIDEVRTSLSVYALPTANAVNGNIENLTYQGSGIFTGTGNSLANTISAGNWATGSALFGAGGDDTLIGGKGNNYLDGGTGADTMTGSSGNDTYIVDNVGDKVVEAGFNGVGFGDFGGIDEVRTTLGTYTLATADWMHGNIENLTYTGTGNFLGHGNTLDNVITGAAGADSMEGGAGNDTLYGKGGADWLFGDDGNDTLDGGAGADVMVGGAGDDTYIVDDVNDVVREANFIGPNLGSMTWSDTGGIDVVKTSLSTYTLADSNATGFVNFKGNIENLTYTGTDKFVGTGNALNNVITGGANNDTLKGGSGNDTIDGAGGDDTAVFSGKSSDYKITDDHGAITIVDLRAGSPDGTDTLLHVEHAQFSDKTVDLGGQTQTGGNGKDVLIGGIGNDTLSGGAGSDTLNGGAGENSLGGGAGNDTFILGAGIDHVDGGTGRDTADYSTAKGAVWVDLGGLEGGDLASGNVWMGPSTESIRQADYLGHDSVIGFLTNVENATGSRFDDILEGTDGTTSSKAATAMTRSMAAPAPTHLTAARARISPGIGTLRLA